MKRKILGRPLRHKVPLVPFTAGLTPSQLERLRAEAERKRVYVSDIFRDAVDLYIRSLDGGGEGKGNTK